MLKFIICDDNLNIANKLKDMIKIIFLKNNDYAEIMLITDNPNEVLDFEGKNQVDVLITDINLNSSITGIDLAKRIRANNKNIYIIFLTGHLEYSLIAYSVKTFDYLPKPITLERLEVTINRLLDDFSTSDCYKFIHVNNKTIINENDINYIMKDGMKVVFCTNSGDIEIYGSFKQIFNKLSDNFIRCHKSYIANINNISNFNINNNIIKFGSNFTCEIGPKYKSKFMEVFKNEHTSNNLDIVNK